MNKNKERHQLLETLLSELREEFVTAWKSFALPTDKTARLEFEVDKALGGLRKILLAPPQLNDADFKGLCDGIRRSWTEESDRVRSEIAAAVSVEKTECDRLRKEIERIDAERQAFNSQPDVIEARRQREESDRQIASLTNEVAHSRQLESRLISLCNRKGIDPNWQPAGESAPGAVLWSKYQELFSEERAGKAAPGRAAAFMREHETELRAYSKSLSGSEETK